MRILNLFLIGWLAIAVPTTAMASIINTDHCQRMKKDQSMSGMNHAQHAMPMQSSVDAATMAHLEHQKKQTDNGCNCGCNCSNQHCATSFTSFMGGLPTMTSFFDGTTQNILRTQPGHLTSAHHLELLRPPTLS